MELVSRVVQTVMTNDTSAWWESFKTLLMLMRTVSKMLDTVSILYDSLLEKNYFHKIM